MEFVQLIMSLLSGAAGGNIVGALMKDSTLGPVVNSIVGLLGGGVGSYILKALGVLATAGAAQATGATGAESLDLGSLIGNIAGSGAGGAALTAIVTLIKNAVSKA